MCHYGGPLDISAGNLLPGLTMFDFLTKYFNYMVLVSEVKGPQQAVKLPHRPFPYVVQEILYCIMIEYLSENVIWGYKGLEAPSIHHMPTYYQGNTKQHNNLSMRFVLIFFNYMVQFSEVKGPQQAVKPPHRSFAYVVQEILHCICSSTCYPSIHHMPTYYQGNTKQHNNLSMRFVLIFFNYMVLFSKVKCPQQAVKLPYRPFAYVVQEGSFYDGTTDNCTCISFCILVK